MGMFHIIRLDTGFVNIKIVPTMAVFQAIECTVIDFLNSKFLCAFKSFHTHRMSVLERLAVPNSRWLCHISCISMLAVSILSISMILKLGSGNVLKCGIFFWLLFFICFIFHFILYLCVYKGPWQERVLIELVSEWLLFIANLVIFQL